MWTNYYLFLLVAVVLIALGLYFFFHRSAQISHFNGIAIDQATSQPTLFIEGQYKTFGEGFFVGDKIHVSALLWLGDKQLYDNLISMPEATRAVIVNNSEDPKDARRDISEAIDENDRAKAFTNPGRLKMVKFYDGNRSNQSIVLDGDVVFTKAGVIEFGFPLASILQTYNVQIQGMPVEPSSTKYEIDLNRTVLLLTFITIAVAFIALFFGLYKKT